MGTYLLTKAETLDYLKGIFEANHVVIDDLIVFTVQDWLLDSEIILKKIVRKYCNGETLIVRSSALDEDNPKDSKAGFYSSILNVLPNNPVKIREAINIVIASYSKSDRSPRPDDQIIIQAQLTDVSVSGVIFTHDLRLDSPYYVINFDDTSGKTDTVTSGISKKALRIARWVDPKSLEYPWQNILSAIKEIEALFPNVSLNIEFGVDRKNVVHIFQSRALRDQHLEYSLQNVSKGEREIKGEVDNLKNQAIKYLKNRAGNKRNSFIPTTILTDMSDWNPAEILGGRPNPLDISLYRYLVTQSGWNAARVSLGYTNTAPDELMVCLADKPYIDTRVSFSSLTPSSFPSEIKNKLIEYYLTKLMNNPHLQDKVEFEIVLSSYAFDFSSRKTELLDNGFSSEDVKVIETYLKSFTNKILQDSVKVIDDDLRRSETLNSFYRNIKEIDNSSDEINNVLESLKVCREFGVIPFARLARLAFIGISLLRSMVREGAISQESADRVLDSTNTITKQFINDFALFQSGGIKQTDFIQQYGHLRPGTYNILAPRYKDIQDYLAAIPANENFTVPVKKQGAFLPTIALGLEKFFDQHGILGTPEFIFHFIQESIRARELSKFYFTKLLSISLEKLARYGELLGIPRNDLALLSLDELEFFMSHQGKKEHSIDLLREKISLNRSQKELWAQIPLPSVIISERDLDIVKYYEAYPNFVTRKKVQGTVILIGALKQNWGDVLVNKIILLENADPGFDWIFTQHPSALITKYGGVASHMAIRCAELDIPAAIGCGDVIFEQCANAKTVLLDCQTELIMPI